MSKKHAELSPSSADRWTTCTASVDAQRGIPNTNSDASRAGTLCHQVQEEVLLSLGANGPLTGPYDFVGRELVFYGNGKEHWADAPNNPYLKYVEEARVTFTEEMADAVDRCVFYVLEQLELRGGTLYVEQRVPIGHITGEDDAQGSADVVIIGQDWAHVLDSKFGRKPVKASSVLQAAGKDIVTGEDTPEVRRPNKQMGFYALGSLRKLDPFDEIKTVTVTVLQPFIDNFDSYSCSIEELNEMAAYFSEKAEETRTNPQFRPSSEACLFCRAFPCAAATKLAQETALEGFDDVETAKPKEVQVATLGTQYALLPFVEQWVKAVEAKVRSELDAGNPVVRSDGLAYKLVDGKMGPRKWRNPEEVEAALKKMRLKQEQIYKMSVISPTDAEKLSKGVKATAKREAVEPVIGPRQWKELQDHIIQSPGQPTIVLETNPKPAISRADGFEDVPAPQDDPLANDIFN